LQALVQPYASTLLNVLDVGSLLVLVLTQIISIVYLYLDSLDENQLPLGMDKTGLEITVTLALFVVNGVVIGTLCAAWIARAGYEKLHVASCRRVCNAMRRVEEPGATRSHSNAPHHQEVQMRGLSPGSRGGTTLGSGETGSFDREPRETPSIALSTNPISPPRCADDAVVFDEATDDGGDGTLIRALAEIAALKAENAALQASATAGVAEIGTGAAMSGEALPRGWTAHATSEGQAYYYNSATGVTEWGRPQAAAQVDAGLLRAGTVTSV
jgi:hypothetical protein